MPRWAKVAGVGWVAVLIFGFLPVWGTTLTVCPSGCDHTTIQAAIDAATAGDTIAVGAGTYNEDINITKGLTLQGTGATITGTGSTQNAVTISADSVTVDGFTVKNPSSSGQDIVGIYAQDHNNLMITNNTVTNVGDSTNKALGIVVISSGSAVSNITITGNQINQIKSGGVDSQSTPHGFSAAGIAIGWEQSGTFIISGLLIQNNTISNITADTSAWPVGHGAYGILINHGINGGGRQTTGAQVLNNAISTLEGLWAHGIGLEGDTPNAVVRGNNISNLVDHKTPSDAVAVQIENNPSASTLKINFNNFSTLSVGVANVTGSGLVDATNNWWGSNDGPTRVNSSFAVVGGVHGVGLFPDSLINATPFIGTSTTSTTTATVTGNGSVDASAQIGAGSSVSVSGLGSTTVTVAQFSGTPAGTPSFSAKGFFDVHLDDVSGVTSVVIAFCPSLPSDRVFFWDTASALWRAVSNQTFVSPNCIEVTVLGSGTFPVLADLTGQFFGLSGGGTTGGDPPIWGNIMAFPTPEYALGQDLNGDGDTLDTVLRYQNLDTGQIVNTGLQVSNRYRDVDLYKHTIVFMEQSPYPVGMIWTYDIDTGQAQQTGIIGFHPTLYGHLLTASSDTVRYLDLDTNTFVDTGLPGTWLSVWGDIIAYQRQVSKDSAPDIRYYNVKTKEVVNTHASGWAPAIYENLVTFATPENEIKQDLNGDGDTNDIVVRYYDINTQQTYNTGQVGNYVSIYGNRIVYSNQNEVYYYDIDTQQAFNTHRLGTEPDIYEGTISYYLWEKWATQDLNTDGDRQDPIVRTFKVSDLDVAMPSRAKTPVLMLEPLSISTLLGYPNPVRLGQDVAFEVEGTGIKDVSVAVFNLAGQRVYESGFVSGNALGWNVLNDEGQRVSNGVYLYVVTARGFDKRVILSQVKKLVVLR